jgi:hypothetical protein
VFSHVKETKKRIPMNVQVDAIPNVERVEIPVVGGDVGDIQIGMDMHNNMRSKIISHFIKGKTSMSPGMEIILIILGELEYLEGFMKLLKQIKTNCCNNIKPQQWHQLFLI